MWRQMLGSPVFMLHVGRLFFARFLLMFLMVNVRIQCRSQIAGGIGVLVIGSDIARGVVGPGPGLPCHLVILPDQLIGRIVGVGRSTRAVADGEDIAIAVP